MPKGFLFMACSPLSFRVRLKNSADGNISTVLGKAETGARSRDARFGFGGFLTPGWAHERSADIAEP